MNSNITYNDIIRALECCIPQYEENQCNKCPIGRGTVDSKWCDTILMENALDLINRQKAEKEKLEYILMGVMHSVDKWLEGDELKHDETNRAVIMREKTLQIVEKQQADIERLNKEVDRLSQCVLYHDGQVVDAVKDFGELAIKTICEKVCAPTPTESYIVEKCNETIDNLIKEI